MDVVGSERATIGKFTTLATRMKLVKRIHVVCESQEAQFVSSSSTRIAARVGASQQPTEVQTASLAADNYSPLWPLVIMTIAVIVIIIMPAVPRGLH